MIAYAVMIKTVLVINKLGIRAHDLRSTEIFYGRREI